MHTAINLSSSISVYLEENESLCDAFDRAGEVLPHGCLAGSCGVCLIDVKQGSELLKAPRTIELDTLNAIKKEKPELTNHHIRLACKAKQIHPGEIHFEKI